MFLQTATSFGADEDDAGKDGKDADDEQEADYDDGGVLRVAKILLMMTTVAASISHPTPPPVSTATTRRCRN